MLVTHMLVRNSVSTWESFLFTYSIFMYLLFTRFKMSVYNNYCVYYSHNARNIQYHIPTSIIFVYKKFISTYTYVYKLGPIPRIFIF